MNERAQMKARDAIQVLSNSMAGLTLVEAVDFMDAVLMCLEERAAALRAMSEFVNPSRAPSQEVH